MEKTDAEILAENLADAIARHEGCDPAVDGWAGMSEKDKKQAIEVSGEALANLRRTR